MPEQLSPLQKFILRNHDLLPQSDIARYLGVEPSIIKAWADDLGLPNMEIPDKERAFPVILRRNHDLLPDNEIAKLLGISIDAYRKTMQEMDFLDVKLGRKPDTLPVIKGDEWNESTAESFRMECAKYLNHSSEWARPFGFLDNLIQIEEPFLVSANNSDLDTRMMYSYTGSHGDFLLTGEDFYSEGILSRLANRGVNAGWMPGLLRDLAPGGIFPELGEGHEIRIENLRKQARKAAAYGVGIYLYLNEPRFMPEEFFRNHPSARGMQAHIPGYYGLCTSDDEVRQWLYESAKFVFTEVPELAGVVLITASENRTNCFSHGNPGEGCPRCLKRGAGPVLSDTASILNKAAENAGTGVEVVQWLWGWPVDDIVNSMNCLPRNVTVMVDWAKTTRFSIFGKTASIGEYTLAYVKPSDYAKKIIEAAKEQGHRIFSKCALVSTVEMNALPYLPVMRNVEKLLEELRKTDVNGVMGCWIFGAYPGRNMEMLAHLGEEHPMQSIARKYYGSGASSAIKAWELFSEGMSYYPSVVSILYLSAVNPGPGIRFSLDPEPWRGGMVAMASEDIEGISQPLGAEAMIKGFRKTAEFFTDGLIHLREAVDKTDMDEWREENEKDFGICSACLCHLRSAANYADFILTRNHWLADKNDLEAKSTLVRLLKDELANAETILEISEKDSRVGYEGAIGYFYLPIEIIEKIYGLKAGIEKLEN